MAGQIVNQAQTDTPGTPVTVLHVSTTSQATTGTSEEVLATYTLPANTLSANGKAIRVTAWGTTAANGNAKTLRIRFGGVGGTVVALNATSTSGAYWLLRSVIIRTGAANQSSIGESMSSNTAVVVASPTQTLSGAVDVVVTGTTTTSAGDATFIGLVVEALN